MIGQYLPNNNEKSYSAVLQKILDLNRPFAKHHHEKVHVQIQIIVRLQGTRMVLVNFKIISI
jgi:type IV secretory pathway TrbF-like protein